MDPIQESNLLRLSIHRIALFGNPERPPSPEVLQLVIQEWQQLGMEVRAARSIPQAEQFHIHVEEDDRELARWADLVVVLGGDGTMLRVAREIAGIECYVFGVNLGTLGFLTACHWKEVSQVFPLVLEGRVYEDPRWLIEAELYRAGQAECESRYLALNDFVISRGATPRLVELDVRVDRELLTQYRGDGLIVSSPTGSTAYSLAAGGAVVAPRAEVFALTPICPHTLSNRSVVISLNSVVEVQLLSERVETIFSADGQPGISLHAQDRIVIRKSRYRFRLIYLKGRTFFGTLREKLHWSGSTLPAHRIPPQQPETKKFGINAQQM